MGIGLGVLLLVVGAICTFTTLDTQYLNTNLNTVGWILMAGGVLALVFGTIQNGQRNRRLTAGDRVERRERVVQDPVDPAMDQRIVEERRVEER